MAILLQAVSSAFAAKWSDFGAYDISWYNKSQTEFQISTPAELAGVAYLVNNNFTSFSGQTLILKDDINLEDRQWTPIGTSNTVFQGNFNGNGHSISGITIGEAYKYRRGFWITLRNASVQNLKITGNIPADNLYVGMIAADAKYSRFKNISVVSQVNFTRTKVSSSTDNIYKYYIGGAVGQSTGCSYQNVDVESCVYFYFGASSGNNVYGGVILNTGGIVGLGEDDGFELCQTKNDFEIGINGYVASRYYTRKGGSEVNYGGIIGKRNSGFISLNHCYSQTKRFVGSHFNGTYDSASFYYGGIIGGSSAYDTTLRDCVAINSNYSVTGHNYSWVASWYHTSSHFGGISSASLSDFNGCYSNNDVNSSVSKVATNENKINGSTSFSSSQMNSQNFVNEINLYTQLEYGRDYWGLDDAGRLTLLKAGVINKVSTIKKSEDKIIISIYDINGLKRSKMQKGVNIIRYSDGTSRKVLVR